MAKIKVGQEVTVKGSDMIFNVNKLSEDGSTAELLRVESESDCQYVSVNRWDDVATALLVVVKAPKEVVVTDTAE
ncbi:MAG: hypothetical protein WC679_00660 [Bacteroidales bacterium]|jgi:hypothetical protein